jgi:Asp-tRNA(Asn)/Glu-tRNA(Gln) amidotransferase A subunit family amidase
LPADAMEWKVLEVYKSMGIDVKPVEFPDSTVYNANLISVILNAESAAAFDELTRTNRDDLIERQDKGFWPNSFRSGRVIPAVEYINANRYRSTLCEKVQDFMKNYDVVIVPTFAGSQLSITNLTGNPVICFPMGYTKTNVPTSITLIGNLYDEASILEAAKAYQDKTDYNKKHPEKFLQ